MPRLGPAAGRGRHRGHGSRPQASRRLPQGGAGHGKSGGAGAGAAQSAASCGEHHRRIRPARRGGHQPLRQRQRGRAEPHPGGLRSIRRAGGAVRGLGKGRRGRPGAGPGGHPPGRRNRWDLYLYLSRRAFPAGENRDRGPADLPGRGRGLQRRRRAGAGTAGVHGPWRSAGVHGQDPVFLLR
ncbi:hypothetical protein SDC9_166270 [bioreactor metagenome]|uniref:Uncharacterized protein n=1 Tax=bioreactor metagenome TaxID=1076179 RepID=A0A645FWT6_9ZZZZ